MNLVTLCLEEGSLVARGLGNLMAEFSRQFEEAWPGITGLFPDDDN